MKKREFNTGSRNEQCEETGAVRARRGGVEVKGMEGNTLRIQYHGACGGYATSTTGTLKYIETQLKQQLHSDLTVQPV